jgi:hypothetical protein
LNPLTANRSASWGCTRQHARRMQETAPVSGVFPVDGPLHLLGIGIQAV